MTARATSILAAAEILVVETSVVAAILAVVVTLAVAETSKKFAVGGWGFVEIF